MAVIAIWGCWDNKSFKDATNLVEFDVWQLETNAIPCADTSNV